MLPIVVHNYQQINFYTLRRVMMAPCFNIYILLYIQKLQIFKQRNCTLMKSHNRARQLISIKNNQIFVHDETLELIKKHGNPFSIIAICGDYRTGKSSLLNFLLQDQQIFKTQCTTQSCTKGIQIIEKPINVNGTNIWIIDTQGFGCPRNENSQMDGKIFLIALMLSSVLLYNSFGVIDKASLRKLQLICFSGKKLDKNFSPSSLVWVLRDFCLLLENENEGGSIGTNEYLENALAQDHIIKEVFKRRQCHTLIRPTIQQQQLGSLKNIRQQFMQSVTQLRQSTFKNLKQKTYDGRVISINKLIKLLKAMVQKINGTQEQLCLQTTWQRIIHNQQEQLISTVYEQMTLLVSDSFMKLPLTNKEFHIIQEQLSEQVKYKTQKCTHKTKCIIEEMKNKIINNISKQNMVKLEQETSSYLKSIFQQLQQRIFRFNIHKFSQIFQGQLNKIRNNYEKRFHQYYQFNNTKTYNKYIQKELQHTLISYINKYSQSIKENQHRIKELIHTNKELQKNDTQYTKMLQHRNAQINMHKRENEKKEAQVSKNRQRLSQLMKEVNGQADRKEELLHSIREKDHKIQTQNHTIQEYEHKLKNANKQIHQLQQQYKEYKQKHSQTQNKIGRALKKYEELQDTLYRQRILYDKLKVQKQHTSQELQHKLLQKEKNSLNLNITISELREQVKKYRKEEEKHKQDNEKLLQYNKEQIKYYTYEYEHIKRQLQDERESFRLFRESEKDKEKVMATQNANLKYSIQQLKQKWLQKFHRDEQQSKEQKETLQQYKITIQKLKEQVGNKQKQNKELRDKFTKNIQDLNSRLVRIRDQNKQSTKKRQQIQKMQQRNNTYTYKLQLQQLNNKLYNSQLQIAKLINRVEKVQKENGILREQNAEKDQRIKEVKEEEYKIINVKKECKECDQKEKRLLDIIKGKTFVINQLQQSVREHSKYNAHKIKRIMSQVIFYVHQLRQQNAFINQLLHNRTATFQQIISLYTNKINQHIKEYIRHHQLLTIQQYNHNHNNEENEQVRKSRIKLIRDKSRSRSRNNKNRNIIKHSPSHSSHNSNFLSVLSEQPDHNLNYNNNDHNGGNGGQGIALKQLQQDNNRLRQQVNVMKQQNIKLSKQSINLHHYLRSMSHNSDETNKLQAKIAQNYKLKEKEHLHNKQIRKLRKQKQQLIKTIEELKYKHHHQLQTIKVNYELNVEKLQQKLQEETMVTTKLKEQLVEIMVKSKSIEQQLQKHKTKTVMDEIHTNNKYKIQQLFH